MKSRLMPVVSLDRRPNASFCHKFGPWKLLNAISQENQKAEGAGKKSVRITGSVFSKCFALTLIVGDEHFI